VNSFSKNELAKIGPALQDVIDSGALSGAVTLVWRNGEVVNVTASGLRDIERQLPMERDTLFRIASMTKPITSVAALMLLEEGRLKLDDPITKWAPEFSGMGVLRDPQGPVDDVYPAAREITVEDLLTHRSGLSYDFTAIGPIASAYRSTLGQIFTHPHAPDSWMKALGSLPLLYAPGERFQYGHSTDVLGFIIGRIAGQPFRDFLVERIFTPLRMADTDFYIPPAKRDRAATIYQIDAATGVLNTLPLPLDDEPGAFTSGGGGLFSTADDYLTFARMLLNKGEVDGIRLLKPDTVELMTHNRLTDAQRQLPFMTLPFWIGQGFGLGVSVITDREKYAWMGVGTNGAFGWPGAFGTWWQADPAENMAMIYMVQNSLLPPSGSPAPELAGKRMTAQGAVVMFQKMIYQALGR
jgi:CubicO group peptidase (beta-lactamase class C family)